MLFYFMDPNSSDDLKVKAKNALKKIIDVCTNLSALEPLLHVAPEEIITHILQQYVTNLKNNPEKMKEFSENGGLQKILELKPKVSPSTQTLINDITEMFPVDLVNYFSPDYERSIIERIVAK